jgi:hypothetical protein
MVPPYHHGFERNCVTDRVGANGRSAVNFSIAAASANYGWIGTAMDSDTGGDFIASPPNTPLNTTLVGYMHVSNSGASASDTPRLNVMTLGG